MTEVASSLKPDVNATLRHGLTFLSLDPCLDTNRNRRHRMRYKIVLAQACQGARRCQQKFFLELEKILKVKKKEFMALWLIINTVIVGI